MKNGLRTLIGDRRRYSLEKAMRLLLESNPNIVGLLWLREEEYVHRHPAFDVLRSQAAAEAFAGSRPGAWRSYADHPEGWENAAHLIRLLRMGNEFITTGTLHVFRTSDADELKVIKRGGWTLDQVKAARPTIDYNPVYGATTGPWTTDRFIETVYADLKKPRTGPEPRSGLNFSSGGR